MPVRLHTLYTVVKERPSDTVQYISCHRCVCVQLDRHVWEDTIAVLLGDRIRHCLDLFDLNDAAV